MIVHSEGKTKGQTTGFKLRHTLRGHAGEIYRIKWSPDGHTIASPSKDNTILLWNTKTGAIKKKLQGHTDRVFSVVWSADGKRLASTARDKTICIWDVSSGETVQTFHAEDRTVYSIAWSPTEAKLATASHDNAIIVWNLNTGQVLYKLEGHSETVYCLAWSPDGQTLASGAADKTIRLWNVENGQVRKILENHTMMVYSLAWSSDGETLASGSADKTIRIWDVHSGQPKLTLEGHTQYVTSVSFSADRQFLASKSGDSTVRLWRCDTWKNVAILEEPRNTSGPYLAGLDFHSRSVHLATLGEEDMVIRLWDLDTKMLLADGMVGRTLHYTNAKVVLVGDTGVGKSGLSLVLAGKTYKETESTHNRHIYVFDSNKVEVNKNVEEMREVLLWDLAGQPGYRLIHQLHLNDIAVALVVFDSRNELDPFSGVFHWVRALRQVQRLKSESSPLKIFLVAARIDRGHVGVSRNRIEALMQTLEFDGYFETSAKEGWQISELRQAIREAIDWTKLPKVSSTDLFKQIRDFVTEERQAGRRLSSREDLYYTFLRMKNAPQNTETLRAQFETCIDLFESRGVIERFNFGDLVLLQPELLDAYASAIVNAAKNEPDGLGYIREEEILAGNFPMSKDERIRNLGQERLLLIATVQKLLRHEIALRIQDDEHSYLVFPSQLTREHPDLANPEGKVVIFRFEGPILNIYATLVVRLANSGFFKLSDMWKNAVAFNAIVGGTCGLLLKELGEGRAEITLFYSKNVSEYRRFQFEEYVHTHLRRRAMPNTIEKHVLITCECGYVIPEKAVEMRKKRNQDWMSCPVCNARITLTDMKKSSVTQTLRVVDNMNKNADGQRDRATATTLIDGKIATTDFDVFLCHNHKDKPTVKKIGLKLKEKGLLPWLDEWELRPGLPWQKILEEQLQKVKSVAVFVGENSIGPWQDMEQAALIREFVRRGCPVIPVILPSCPEQPPELPMFLGGMTWIDFRKQYPDPLQQLIWGITGERDQIML